MSEDTQELLDLANALIKARMESGGIRKQKGQISSTENEPLSTLMEMRKQFRREIAASKMGPGYAFFRKYRR